MNRIFVIKSSVYFTSIDKLNDFDQNRATSGSSIKSQVLDLKTLPILSPLKRGVSNSSRSDCLGFSEVALQSQKNIAGVTISLLC